MAENQFGKIAKNISSISGKPLLKKFMKYFDNTDANKLRSIDFGKFLFKTFYPDREIPSDSAALLNATHSLFTLGFDDSLITDEAFVRFVIEKCTSEPGLLTFDMVADLVESPAYKKFGRNSSEDALKKKNFEKKLIFASMLDKINEMSPDDVVLSENSMRRVVTALEYRFVEPQKAKTKLEKQIKEKIDEFDDTYVNHANKNTVKELQKISSSKGQEPVTQLKSIYSVLCDDERAGFFAEVLDSITIGAKDSNMRQKMIEGAAVATNKILYAVAQRKGLSDQEFEKISYELPLLKRSAQFEQQAAKIAGKKTTKTLNPVVDVARTFAQSLTGATVISTISAIPGVGTVVGPLLGVATVFTAGVSAGIANYRKAKIEAKARGEELNKTDAKKIALKTGVAMMGKAVPYAMAMALGPKMRAVGASIVFAKTMFNDLERRAGIQRVQIEQIEAQSGKPKKFVDRLKNIANHVKNITNSEVGRWKNIATAVKEKRLNRSDFVKAATYGAAKGGAVYLGGLSGAKLGHAFGSNVSFHNDNGEFNMKVDTAQIKENVREDWDNSKLGKLFSKFSGMREQSVESTPIHYQSPADVAQQEAYKQTMQAQHDAHVRAAEDAHLRELQAQYQAQQDFDTAQQDFDTSSTPDDKFEINASQENLQRLNDEFKNVEITDKAYYSADPDNDKQCINGVQKDWGTKTQFNNMVGTLEEAGMSHDDAVAAVRKLGSAMRFRAGDFKTAWDDLGNGVLNDNVIDALCDANQNVDETGDWIGNMENNTNTNTNTNTDTDTDTDTNTNTSTSTSTSTNTNTNKTNQGNKGNAGSGQDGKRNDNIVNNSTDSYQGRPSDVRNLNLTSEQDSGLDNGVPSDVRKLTIGTQDDFEYLPD